MTVKQLIVGTLLGATAVAVLMHRLPQRVTTIALKPATKDVDRTVRAIRKSHKKHVTEDRLSLNKMFG